MNPNLTIMEITQILTKGNGDPNRVHRIYNYVDRAIDAQLRKALTWAVQVLYEDEEFPCGKRLCRIMEMEGIEPWEER